MTQIFTFRAPDMNAAMARLRDEFGPTATVRESREVPRKRRLPWQKAVIEVEVTAELVAAESSFAQQSIAEGGIELTDLDEPPTEFDTPSTAQSNRLSALEDQLNSIQNLLMQVGHTTLSPEVASVPVELFDLYAELLDADLDEQFARDLIQKLSHQTRSSGTTDLNSARLLLSDLVQSQLACRGPIQVVPGQRHVVALVGPTGVGKTTTIAKLAANFRLRDGIKVGLVTVDTFRIAAVEQLRTYAEIIDLPMKIVTSPEQMQQAMDDFTEMDLVLIDTAGRSPRDEVRIQELRELLERAAVDEVHLVMSLTAGRKSLLSTIRNFKLAGVSSLLLTKLDEAESLGTILELTEEFSLAISYLTTGQNVPDDIEAADAARLANLILGRDRVL